MIISLNFIDSPATTLVEPTDYYELCFMHIFTLKQTEEIQGSNRTSPFGYLIGLLYQWFRYGKTAETESFERYIIRRQ